MKCSVWTSCQDTKNFLQQQHPLFLIEYQDGRPIPFAGNYGTAARTGRAVLVHANKARRGKVGHGACDPPHAFRETNSQRNVPQRFSQ